MSNFAATVNAGAAVLRQRHLQALHQSERQPAHLRTAELSQFVHGGGDRRSHRLVRRFGEFGGDLDRLRLMGRLHGLQRPEVVLVAFFNGYGYFWGMVTGITASLTIPGLLSRIPRCRARHLHQLNLDVSLGFGLVFVIGMIGCLVGTLLTPAEDDAVLMEFYRRVRPWGSGPDQGQGDGAASHLPAERGFRPRHVQHRHWHSLADRAGSAADLHRDPDQHSRHLVLPGRGRRDVRHFEVHLVRPYVQGERGDRGGRGKGSGGGD